MDKLERKRKVIERLLPFLELFHKKSLETNLNWKTDEKQCLWVYVIAKRMLEEALYDYDFLVESKNYGGLGGSQLITTGTIKRRGKYKINYTDILNKWVERIYSMQIPSIEEQTKIIENFAKEPDNETFESAFNSLRKDMYSEFLIRGRLNNKLFDYLMRKEYVDSAR